MARAPSSNRTSPSTTRSRSARSAARAGADHAWDPNLMRRGASVWVNRADSATSGPPVPFCVRPLQFQSESRPGAIGLNDPAARDRRSVEQLALDADVIVEILDVLHMGESRAG